MTEDPLIDIFKVAKKLDVVPGTISNWLAAKKKGFPPGFKLGTGKRAPRRWRESVIDEYIARCEKQSA